MYFFLFDFKIVKKYIYFGKLCIRWYVGVKVIVCDWFGFEEILKFLEWCYIYLWIVI